MGCDFFGRIWSLLLHWLDIVLVNLVCLSNHIIQFGHFAILLPLDVQEYGRNRNMVGATKIATENRRYGGIVRFIDSGCLP